MAHLVSEWQGKEILFPENVVYTKYVTDTVRYEQPESEYKILVYVDSTGCTSCKLQLDKWKKLMCELDSSSIEIPLLFYFQTTDHKEIYHILRQDRFEHPVCIDTNDQLNRLNRFPSDMAFLLNKENKVVLIGNPVHNPAIKELYLKQIRRSQAQF